MQFSAVNAKAETLNSKPMWKRLLQKQRCLIPADGYYEWEGILGKKMPWRFTLKNEEPFCFAGLWDRCSDSSQETSAQLSAVAVARTKDKTALKDWLWVLEKFGGAHANGWFRNWKAKQWNDHAKLLFLVAPDVHLNFGQYLSWGIFQSPISLRYASCYLNHQHNGCN